MNTHLCSNSLLINKLFLLFLPAILFLLYSCNTVEQGNAQPMDVSRIYSINTDGTNLKLLASGNSFVFSQTGDSMFYNYNYAVYYMDLNGANSRLMAENAFDLWLSSGKNKICFTHLTTTKPYFMNTDGSGLTKLNVPDSFKYIESRWDISPSGNKVVFSAYAGIYIMNIDGSNLKRLKDTVNPSTYYFSLYFTPDGSSIIYSPDQSYIKIYNLADGTYKTIFWKNSYTISFYELSPSNALLFGDYQNIYSANLIDDSHTLLTKGTFGHFSFDESKFAYVIYDSSGINTYNLPSGPVTHIDVNLPGNAINDPA